MSRGFVKEGDQEERPLVTPRAYLPDGVVNYVTPAGMNLLKDELNKLLEEKNSLKKETNKDNRVQIDYITAKLNLLEQRISSAKVIDLSIQPKGEVHFGAIITLYKEIENTICQYQIVGVDEADVAQNKVSFLSPIAKVLLTKKIGDIIELQTPRGKQVLKIDSITY